MKVFRLFRHKKYGEPIVPVRVPKSNNFINESNTFNEEDI